MKDNNRIHSHKYMRRSKQSNRSATTPSLGWVWLCSGILIGIIGVIVIHSYMSHPSKIKALSANASIRAHKPKAQQTEATKPSTKNEAPKKYEFYTLLPGMEVQLPPTTNPSTPPLATSPVVGQTPRPAATVVKQTPRIAPPITKQPKQAPLTKLVTNLPHANPKTTAAPKEESPTVQSKLAAAHYLIQAGVFALAEDAKELATRIEAKGFKPQLYKVKMRNGVTAYRVILGPYPTEVMALSQKKQLEHKKIHGILILKR